MIWVSTAQRDRVAEAASSFSKVGLWNKQLILLDTKDIKGNECAECTRLFFWNPQSLPANFGAVVVGIKIGTKANKTLLRRKAAKEWC